MWIHLKEHIMKILQFHFLIIFPSIFNFFSMQCSQERFNTQSTKAPNPIFWAPMLTFFLCSKNYII